MEFIAHSQNTTGNEHKLNTHLLRVSSLMKEMCLNEQFYDIFATTGLLHDLGKYQQLFQKYLREGGRRGSVPHAIWGAALCKTYGHNEAAFAIDGHHKGLPNKGELISNLSEFRDSEHPLLTVIKTDFFRESSLSEKDLRYQDTLLRGTDKEVFIRLLFSALTDADWLDTESHFNHVISDKRISQTFDASYLIDKIETELNSKSKEGYLNILRNEVLSYAIANAHKQVDFYSMTLPTGMGKTLASVSWALHHARHNNLNRIIIVLPFISIIDQTAKELKRIFGDEWVLEHHSNFNDDDQANRNITNESLCDEKYSQRLATENWDYPIIVTTSVQFFESLFGNKPSRCRKVHNIAQSVVIFDEVQTLPKELVLPTLSMLQNVQRVMGTSFLFCTATQPAFEKSESFAGIDRIHSLVENPKEIFDATRRVNYFAVNEYYPVTINELSGKVLDQNCSTLCIFNTKKQALLFFNDVKENATCRVFHLSTSMYPTHRKQIIAEIRQRLQANEKILVASTQLIEAGVDFDFPCVFREIAPLESIIQSAGRCNREGKMAIMGSVYIFSMEERPRPMKQYYSLADFANTMYKGKEDLLFEHDFFKEYYRKALNLFVDADKKKIDDDRKGFNFKTVAEKYHLIENATTPVFILCDESAELYDNIRYKPILSKADYRAMQQYSVQVYDNFIKDNVDKMGIEPQGYWKWYGVYNNDYGLSTNPQLDTLIL